VKRSSHKGGKTGSGEKGREAEQFFGTFCLNKERGDWDFPAGVRGGSGWLWDGWVGNKKVVEGKGFPPSTVAQKMSGGKSGLNAARSKGRLELGGKGKLGNQRDQRALRKKSMGSLL